MSAAGRQVLERLLAAHEAFFDVERDYAFAGRTFPGYAEFHSSASQYVLVKRAKLWEASAHEYLFFQLCDHLDRVAFDDAVAFMTTEALAKVQLDPDHMTSYLSLVLIADTVDDALVRTIKRTHFRRNFALGFKGWADLRVGVIDLARGAVVTNTQGKPLKDTLVSCMRGGAQDPKLAGGEVGPKAEDHREKERKQR